MDERNLLPDFCDIVKQFIADNHCYSFKNIQRFLKQILGRKLEIDEQNLITKILFEYSTFISLQDPPLHESTQIQILPNDILICMAYSNDYTIGNICETINGQYATLRGYQFYSQQLSYENIMKTISPRQHCAWYKAFLIRNLLHNYEIPFTSQPIPQNWKYLVWIDSDALILNFNLSIEDIIYNNFPTTSCPKSSISTSNIYRRIFPDLIIAQDFSLSSSCPINSGVMIIQKTPWSQSLWEDVWSHPFCEKYHDVYFYDQSALVKCLKLRNIHFPSCLESPDNDLSQGDKIIPELHTEKITRVRILPCSVLNSNRISFPGTRDQKPIISIPSAMGDLSAPFLSLSHLISESDHATLCGLRQYDLSDVDRELLEDHDDGPEINSKAAKFIFHAVGGWNKMKALLRVCQLYDLIIPEDIMRYCQANGIDFRLYRGKCGGVALKEKIETNKEEKTQSSPL